MWNALFKFVNPLNRIKHPLHRQTDKTYTHLLWSRLWIPNFRYIIFSKHSTKNVWPLEKRVRNPFISAPFCWIWMVFHPFYCSCMTLMKFVCFQFNRRRKKNRENWNDCRTETHVLWHRRNKKNAPFFGCIIYTFQNRYFERELKSH